MHVMTKLTMIRIGDSFGPLSSSCIGWVSQFFDVTKSYFKSIFSSLLPYFVQYSLMLPWLPWKLETEMEVEAGLQLKLVIFGLFPCFLLLFFHGNKILVSENELKV